MLKQYRELHVVLERGAASLIEALVAAGRPSSCDQHTDDRKAGYIISMVFAGEMEMRVWVGDTILESIHFRVVSLPTADGLLLTLIYYCNGCFASGGLIIHDGQLRQLAMFSSCRMTTAQYRPAPEHTFPTMHDDTERGTTVICRHAKQLGVDAPRIVLVDGNAGSHLVLVMALRLKAKAAWYPTQLILIYPTLNPTVSMASYLSNDDGYVIIWDTLLSNYEMYLVLTPANRPDASPF